MKRLILWLFVVIVSGCCVFQGGSGGTRMPSSQRAVVDRLFDQTVALVAVDDASRKQYAFCGGTWITQDTFLTAKHCTDSAADGDLMFWEHQSDAASDETRTLQAGKLIDIDPDHDLSLVRAVTHGRHGVATLALHQIDAGENVRIVGHPAGLTWTYMRGFVSATRSGFLSPVGLESKMLQISAPITFGSSGGGAFDEEGHLIGVASFIRKNVPNISFFVHRDSISEFLVASSVNPD